MINIIFFGILLLHGGGEISYLRIHLLGPPRIESAGQQIKVDTRKAIALLAYLAIHKARHRRESLISLLYPDYDSNRAHTNFRRTLYALRKNLPEDCLETDWESVSLHPGVELWVDVNQFNENIAKCLIHGHTADEVCPACISPLTEAIKLYQGDFLSGFTINDSDEFDRWQSQQTESLRMKFFGAIELLVEGHQTQGEFKTAIQYAREWQALDPLNETAYRKLMLLYAWSGQRSAAISQYQECVRLLKEELDVPPAEATTRLFDEITKDKIPPRPSTSTHHPLPQTRFPGNNLNSTNRDPIDNTAGIIELPNTICVGRQLELTHLNHSLDAMLSGQGHPLFIIGGPGQGKTNLIQEFARQAQERSVELLFASGICNAFSGFGDPYLPFREILNLLTCDVDALWAAGTITQEHSRRLWEAFPLAIETIINYGPDLVETFIPGRPLSRRAAAYMAGRTPDQSTWLPELEKLIRHKVDARHDPNFAQAALFEQYTRVVAALSQQKPILITLDDLQWADNGSISLLFHLGRRLAGKKILIVCAYRPEEIAIGRAGEQHPLEPVIHELRRMYDDNTIDLSKAESRSFVDAYIDSEPNRVDAHFRHTIIQKTEGHPLFTIELLRGMEERGDLVLNKEGYWIEGKSLDWEILPSRIEAVIAERISRLDDSLKEFLRVACVEGEIFSAEVIAHVLSIDERKIVEYLSTQLEHKHRLIHAQEIQRLGMRQISRYRFKHYLFQNYLYQSLDLIERAHLHEAVGMALEALYQEAKQDISMSLSRHFQEAGNTEKAITYLFMAGEKAIRTSDHETAITLFTRGLEMLESLPLTPDRDNKELQFLIDLGLLFVLTKGHPANEVESTYQRALDLSVRTGDNLQQFQILLGLRRYHLHRGDIHKAGELGESLLHLVQDMPNSIHFSRAHFMQGEILYRMGEFSRALEHCEKGLAANDPSHSQEQIFVYGNDCGVGCRTFAAISLWHLGYPDQALGNAKEVLSLIHKLSHPFTLAFGLYFIATLYLLPRDTRSVQECVEELLRISRERGFTLYTACGSVLQGWVMVQGDAVTNGLQYMEKGLELWSNLGAKLMLPTFFIFISEAHGKVGHIDEGLALLDQANTIMQDTGERTYEAELYRRQGELLLRKDNHQAEAENKFQKALEIARIHNARSWELRAAVSLSRLWMNQDKLTEARVLLSGIYNWFTEGFDTPDLQEAKALLDQLAA